MKITLKDSKAKLSELVNRASGGDEVIITVRGKPKVKLVPVEPIKEQQDFAEWSRVLREEAARYSCKVSDSSGGILDEMREDRA